MTLDEFLMSRFRQQLEGKSEADKFRFMCDQWGWIVSILKEEERRDLREKVLEVL